MIKNKILSLEFVLSLRSNKFSASCFIKSRPRYHTQDSPKKAEDLFLVAVYHTYEAFP